MKEILVIGYLMQDIKGTVSGDYRPRERNVGDIAFCNGGVSRNTALNIARTGLPVRFLSLCEHTAQGDGIERELREAGVLTDFRYCKKNGIGLWMVIQANGGQETLGQLSCPPSREELETLVSESAEQYIRDCSCVIAEIDASAVMSAQIFAWAEKYRKPVYTVVGNLAGILGSREMLRHLDCFVCNDMEMSKILGYELYGSSDAILHAVYEKTEPLGIVSAVVTLGERGSVYFDRRTGEYGVCPAEALTPVDPTGAGDAFLSGLVMAKQLGMGLGESARMGTRLAREALLTKESCVPSLPGFWNQEKENQ